MKNLILILLLTLTGSLLSACLGHKLGEIYFTAYSKDVQGKYTVWTLYRTEDYGATAQVVEKNFDYRIYSDAQPGCFYKVTWGETLYFSNDTCRTWTYRTQDASNIFTTRHPGLVYINHDYSLDYGATWNQASYNGLPNNYKSCIGFEKSEKWAYGKENFKTYRSTDYGNNFVYVDSIVPNLEAGGMFAGWQPGEVCLGNLGVIYHSIDYGHTFSFLYDAGPIFLWGSYLDGWARDEVIGIRTVRNYQLTTQKITFYHLTNYQANVDSVECNYNVGIEDNQQLIKDNGQLVNYPNPFNNSTVVNYVLPNNTDVDLAIYNAKGEFVRKLYSGKQNKGEYQISLNADDLNSGVYYIKLKYGSNLKVHKILLVK